MGRKLATIAASWSLLVSLAWLPACNSSEFGGESKKQESDKKKTSDRPNNPDAGDSDGDGGADAAGDGVDADDGADGGGLGGTAGADAGIADAGDAADEGGVDADIQGTDSGAADSEGDTAGVAGALITEDEASCLLRKGDNFRILFVLDNSLSTKSTDPANVRLEAGLRLIDKFTDFVKANPKATFKTGTVGFNNKAVSGAHAWVKLADATRANIEADLKTATTDPGIGTHFDKAMPAAQTFFTGDNATAKETRQRTYMIFLSDGEANGSNDAITDIVPLVTNMVNNNGVAVYSIIIGKSPGNRAVEMMKALALPVAGVVGPDHTGTYVHAPDAAAIDQAFADFFKKVTGC
jgi:hypothetical protein